MPGIVEQNLFQQVARTPEQQKVYAEIRERVAKNLEEQLKLEKIRNQVDVTRREDHRWTAQDEHLWVRRIASSARDSILRQEREGQGRYATDAAYREGALAGIRKFENTQERGKEQSRLEERKQQTADRTMQQIMERARARSMGRGRERD